MTWTAMLALGAYHGINPGMGWLFAVALGMQQGSARGVCRALPPIALGHAAAVAAVLAAAATVGIVVPMPVLKAVVAATLVVLGCYRLWSHRHPRFGGMQVGFRDLTVWSFLMASAHGAGFMLLPWVMAMPADVSLAPGGHAGHVMTMSAGDAGTAWAGLLAVGVHTAAYLLVMTLAAWIVYRKIGLAFLRTAWFNLDWLWAGALVITGVVMVAPLLSTVAFSQSADSTSAFALADVHVSPRSTTSAMRVSSRAGRYEIRNATMVDLIRTAYTVDAENVLGGPSWLEYDRFDVVALVPPNTSPDTQKLMLRTLVADRFKLAVRRETKPAAGLVLVAGKGKHKLKEAADSAPAPGAPGCQTQAVPAARPSGVPGQFVLPMSGLACHNVTMETFASDLKRLSNGYVTNAVVDQTGLKGSWDFELKFTQRALLGIAAQMDGASATSLSDAIDKQLGLKLEERDIPTPALIVEQVNAKPTTNSLDVATKLPPPPPMEFEVADIKPVDPNVRRTGPIQLGVLPGGRVNLPGLPLKLVITLAWSLPTNQNDQLIGGPKWLDSARFDIIGKLPSDLAPANGTNVPLQELGPALQALLVDRFKMKVHFEDRPVDAYTLIAVKPKLKKSDPSTRTGCKAPNAGTFYINSSAGLPVQTFNCQNITMAQFADRLQVIAGTYIRHPVVDATGLEGAWDFTLSFSPMDPRQLASLLAGARGAPPVGAAGTADATASDPMGGGASLFDAVEKQLGLKLDVHKRTYPVFIIDHIEEKPTDN